MAKQLSVGYTDTSISGMQSLTIPLSVNFGSDYRIQTDKPEEVVMVNLTTDLGLPERFRFALNSVSNVYSGTNIDPGLYTPTKRGVSLLVQNTETWKLTDSEDTAYLAALPVECHIVVRIPADTMITPELVQGLINRTVNGFYQNGLKDTDRLNALIRGSLKPSV